MQDLNPADADGVYDNPRWLRGVQVRHVVALLIVLGVAVASSRLWIGYLPDWLVYRSELKQARRAIERIDDFARTGRALPPDLCAIGLPCDESARLQYVPADGGYSLWFGAPTHGFFRALVYHSVTRTWHLSDG